MRDWPRESFACSLSSYALVALALGGIYLATLLPGVGYSGDTAKFQFVGEVLGTPHATGYPTYLILNHLFVTLFPLGSSAFKANLLSALFSIAASLVLLRIMRLLQVSGWIAVATAVAFGLTQTIWLQSLVAEVYTLHLLFVALVILFFLRWLQTRLDRDLLLACAVYALSFGNHMTAITLLPAIVYLVWTTDRYVFVNRKIWLVTALLVALALAQYLYIFWRVRDPATLYLEMRPTNLEEFLWYMTGARFRAQMFVFTIAELITQRLPMLASLLWKQFFVLLPLALVGFVNLRDRRINGFLLLIFLGNTLYAVNYDIYDVFVYFMPSYLIVAVYIGLGLEVLRRRWPGRARWLGAVLLALIPLLLFAINLNAVNQRKEITDAARVERVLQQIGSEAVLIAPDYHYAEYFWYYLLGQERGQRPIYVLHRFSPEAVRAYLQGSQSFNLPNPLQGEVPFGLPMYGMSADQRSLLEQDNLSTEDATSDLYVIHLPSQPVP